MNKMIMISIIMICIILILYITCKTHNLESFINSESECDVEECHNTFDPSSNVNSVFGMNIQLGKSGISPTGTIYFKTPFERPPMILTQMIGDTSTSKNIYSIQVFGITNTSFNYSKNKLYNYQVSDENIQNMNLMNLELSSTESFMWVAFG